MALPTLPTPNFMMAPPPAPLRMGVPLPPAPPMAPLPLPRPLDMRIPAPIAPSYAASNGQGITMPTLPASLSGTVATPKTYGGTTLAAGAPIRMAASGGIAGFLTKMLGRAAHVGHRAGGKVGGGVGSGVGGGASQAIRGARGAGRLASRSGGVARSMSRGGRGLASSAASGGFLKALGISALITVPLVALSDYMDFRAGKITAAQRNTLIVADSAGYIAAGGIGTWIGVAATGMMGGFGAIVGLAAGAGLGYAYERFIRPKF